ncbi:MAG: YciI-like protein [Parvularcula sp.]
MKHFALIYEAVPDILERRAPYRAQHLALLKEEEAAGRLLLAGALAGAPAGSLLVFKGEDDDAARAFAARDPYVANGLIENWTVREWITVVGEGAAQPV